MLEDYAEVLAIIADHLEGIEASFSRLHKNIDRLSILLTCYIQPHQDEICKAIAALATIEGMNKGDV